MIMLHSFNCNVPIFYIKRTQLSISVRLKSTPPYLGRSGRFLAKRGFFDDFGHF